MVETQVKEAREKENEGHAQGGGMKITRIRVREVSVPLLKSYTISRVGTLTQTGSVVLEMDTDQGLTGVGESDPALMFTGESQHTVMAVLRHHLGPAILGRNPLDLEQLHGLMDSICVGNPFAKAAIDLACNDIAGKVLNVPVYQLYGGLVSESIEVMWSLGSDSVEANVEDAVRRVEEGYRTIGLKVGTFEPQYDIARLRAVRRAIGSDIRIRCDANQAWGAAEAIETIRRMEEFDICMVEQPVAGWDIEGSARVKAAVNVPVAADEGLHSPRDALKIIQADAADIFSIKTTKMGGLLPSWKTAAIIQAAGYKVFVNSMIELGVSVMSGLNFAVTNSTLFPCGHALNSVRRLQDDILAEPPPYDGNKILAPRGRVGLGVVLDQRKMSKYTVSEFCLP
jgi:L-alanine-DL-glutamate epimerase-like enolase superfamily enzyme